MFCQLDQVKDILDIAEAVQEALLETYPAKQNLEGCGKEASTAIFAFLLLKEYDVFLQEGVLNIGGEAYQHHWVELYLDGEAFVLDVTLSQFTHLLNKRVSDVLLVPGDEAAQEYGYGVSREIAWQPEACQDTLWQKIINKLQLALSVEQLLEQVEELIL